MYKVVAIKSLPHAGKVWGSIYFRFWPEWHHPRAEKEGAGKRKARTEGGVYVVRSGSTLPSLQLTSVWLSASAGSHLCRHASPTHSSLCREHPKPSGCLSVPLSSPLCWTWVDGFRDNSCPHLQIKSPNRNAADHGFLGSRNSRNQR